MRIKRSVAAFLYYLNPKNVSAAIEEYGYAYRVRNTVLAYLLVLLAAVASGHVFRLGVLEVGAVALYGLAALPRVMMNNYKKMYEQKRFSDVNLYIEQVLYSFQKTPRIISALQDVEKIMPKDSPMRDAVKEAAHYILHEYSEESPLGAALLQIERKYRCQRLRDAHALMVKTESIGGDYGSAVKILLSSRAIWETETCKFQKECKNRQRMVNIALALVCGVCLFTPLMITKFAPEVDIMSTKAYKIGTMAMILIAMRTYRKADGMAAVNWLENESDLTDEEQKALFYKVRHFCFPHERRKSLLYAALPLTLGALCLIWKWSYAAAACAALAFIAFNQHTISYRLAKRRCREEIARAFPQWLMEISLLLQVTENVNAAVAISIEDAPAILLEGLKELRDGILRDPESNEPYLNFLREFGILEIQSAMGMLYAISSGRGGDASAQIDEILSKNASLLSQSERAANEGRLAALYWQFLFPSLIGGGKLVVDMTLVTVAFLSFNVG